MPSVNKGIDSNTLKIAKIRLDASVPAAACGEAAESVGVGLGLVAIELGRAGVRVGCTGIGLGWAGDPAADCHQRAATRRTTAKAQAAQNLGPEKASVMVSQRSF